MTWTPKEYNLVRAIDSKLDAILDHLDDESREMSRFRHENDKSRGEAAKKSIVPPAGADPAASAGEGAEGASPEFKLYRVTTKEGRPRFTGTYEDARDYRNNCGEECTLEVVE